MPFIGNQPALSYTSFAKQDFSTSATTSYTLDNPVANANELALFINFVRQEPTTAYSASGTTLTLTSATASSDDMYCVYLGKAVQTVNPPNASVGTSQLVDSAVSSAKMFSGFSNGITMADQWRLTADLVGAGAADITSNLERVDDATFAKIGTGMTESSGIFTFPSTGLYLLSISVFFHSRGNDEFGTVKTNVSSDSGSSFSEIAHCQGGNANNNPVTHNTSIENFVNVTNTSNFQIKFSVSSQTYNDVKGATDHNKTHFTFIRLGDSQ
jgi:hypothetical protein